MNPMKFFWGLLISGIGILLLGTNLGWWDYRVWSSLWLFWPLIFVVLGLRFIIEDEKLFIGLVLLLMVGVGYLVVAKQDETVNKWLRNEKRETQELTSKSNETVKNAKYNFDLGASEVIFGSLDDNDSKSNLYKIKAENYGLLKTRENITNDTMSVEVNEEFDRTIFHPRMMNQRNLSVLLSNLLPTQITINGGASKFDLDFSKILLTNLTISSGASSGDIKLGDKVDKANVKLDTGASRVKFMIPKGVGVKVDFDSENGLNSRNFDNNFSFTKESEHTYVSKDYDSATKKIEIEISAGASSIQINQY